MLHLRFLLWVGVIGSASSAHAAVVASYEFQNTLASSAGGPALNPVDPLGGNGFETATVFGDTRTVYRFDGNNSAGENAGLTLDATGLMPLNNYSVELVFEFTTGGRYRKILDFANRTVQDGLYATIGNSLQLYKLGGGGLSEPNPSLALNTYYHVVLTNQAGTNQVSGYVNGAPRFSGTSDVPDIANSSDLLHFFLDDGGFEYSDGIVALIRLYDNVLTPAEVGQLAAMPFAAVPEVGAWAPLALAAGASGLIGIGQRRARKFAAD